MKQVAVVVAMLSAVLAGCAQLSLSSGEEVRTLSDPAQGFALSLSNKPCTDPKVTKHLEQLGDKIRTEYKEADLTYEGKPWKSCYILFVASIDEEGAPMRPIYYFMFKPESELKSESK